MHSCRDIEFSLSPAAAKILSHRKSPSLPAHAPCYSNPLLYQKSILDSTTLLAARHPSIRHFKALSLPLPLSSIHSLHLTNNLTRPAQTLHHLLTLLPPPHSIIALPQQIIQFRGAVHLLQQFPLHFLFRVSVIIIISKPSLHIPRTSIRLTRQAST